MHYGTFVYFVDITPDMWPICKANIIGVDICKDFNIDVLLLSPISADIIIVRYWHTDIIVHPY